MKQLIKRTYYIPRQPVNRYIYKMDSGGWLARASDALSAKFYGDLKLIAEKTGLRSNTINQAYNAAKKKAPAAFAKYEAQMAAKRAGQKTALVKAAGKQAYLNTLNALKAAKSNTWFGKTWLGKKVTQMSNSKLARLLPGKYGKIINGLILGDGIKSLVEEDKYGHFKKPKDALDATLSAAKVGSFVTGKGWLLDMGVGEGVKQARDIWHNLSTPVSQLAKEKKEGKLSHSNNYVFGPFGLIKAFTEPDKFKEKYINNLEGSTWNKVKLLGGTVLGELVNTMDSSAIDLLKMEKTIEDELNDLSNQRNEPISREEADKYRDKRRLDFLALELGFKDSNDRNNKMKEEDLLIKNILELNTANTYLEVNGKPFTGYDEESGLTYKNGHILMFEKTDKDGTSYLTYENTGKSPKNGVYGDTYVIDGVLYDLYSPKLNSRLKLELKAATQGDEVVPERLGNPTNLIIRKPINNRSRRRSSRRRYGSSRSPIYNTSTTVQPITNNTVTNQQTIPTTNEYISDLLTLPITNQLSQILNNMYDPSIGFLNNYAMDYDPSVGITTHLLPQLEVSQFKILNTLNKPNYVSFS